MKVGYEMPIKELSDVIALLQILEEPITVLSWYGQEFIYDIHVNDEYFMSWNDILKSIFLRGISEDEELIGGFGYA